MATYGFSVLLITVSLVVVTTYATRPTLDADETIDFGYVGDKGPDKWGSLDPKFKLCSDGKAQSPIDISRSKATHLEDSKGLAREYRSAKATFVNNGFSMAVHFEENAGTMIVDNKNYTLSQMHWHTPSEHKIDGQLFDAELQLVHLADDGNITITAVLYQIGGRDSFLSRIQNKFGFLSKENHTDGGILDANQLRISSRNYFRYNGSFTTPPCTENVIWFVFGKLKTMSKEQIEAIKAPLEPAFKNNSRPVQPDNGREVCLHDDPKPEATKTIVN
ncbi:Carbonic anhydrase [Heracleum sosnowskyi]|uniref:Carbonic anhydrase n=1 Tax=Heracleum sosnowskyi TaxID=360622 RepID=A0AAD8HZ69_9APIA|nr:Carbonic anhydrase [Heracleum sosnowskyi]